MAKIPQRLDGELQSIGIPRRRIPLLNDGVAFQLGLTLLYTGRVNRAYAYTQ